MPDLVTSQIFQDGEKGITATKLNNIIADSVIQPDFYNNKASSATLDPTDQFLELKGTGSYARITGSQLVASVSSQVDVTPQIYSTRLRSFNAVGNPSFEVAQRNVGALLTSPPTNTFLEDRWILWGGTSLSGWTAQRQSSLLGAGNGYAVPGTNFIITTGYAHFTVTSPTASLAAGQILGLYQLMEGSQFREMSADVHSVSIYARSSIANLSFGLFIRDPGHTRSLTKLCTLGAANTPTLITLPNLPVFPGAGNFSMAVGNPGYEIGIILACGSTNMSPANDVWQTGAFAGAVGQSNFMATNGATLDLIFLQHEPGAVCTTLMDKPFTQNLDECLRYFTKSYDYDVAVGTANAVGDLALMAGSSTSWLGTPRFPKPMAKVPTCVCYSLVTGAANMLRSGADYPVTAFTNLGKGGFQGVTTSSGPALVLGLGGYVHYTADTGW